MGQSDPGAAVHRALCHRQDPRLAEVAGCSSWAGAHLHTIRAFREGPPTSQPELLLTPWERGLMLPSLELPCVGSLQAEPGDVRDGEGDILA